MRPLLSTQFTLLIAALLITATVWTTPARAADTERLDAFLISEINRMANILEL